MDSNSLNAAAAEAALRLVDREVWIVTAADGERRGGLLATWVSTASIDSARPVLLAGIGPNHFTAELVQSSKAFAAHLLRLEQTEVAWNFARDSGRERDKLVGMRVERGSSGSPVLDDCLAWFDCRVFARYDAGDRLFFWADVVGLSSGAAGALPLRESQFFRQLSDEQRRTLAAAREGDAVRGRALYEAWRGRNPW